VDAHYKNGVLELTLTKTGEAVSKAIDVFVLASSHGKATE
jgi:hypothetical protein